MKILVADDDAVARFVLEDVLSEWGYEVVLATDGRQACDILLGDDPPPLATLDWMMPGMEGPDICRTVKQKKGKYTYLIVLTSKTEKGEVAQALDAGADDFISKPVDTAELRARLAAGVRVLASEHELDRKNIELDQYAQNMEALAMERARQLVHADRLATLGVLSAGIAHEVASPISFISGNLGTLSRVWETIESALKDCIARGSGEVDRLAMALEEGPKILQGMGQGVDRTVRLIQGLKRYARTDSEAKTPCSLNDCLDNALYLCSNKLKYNVKIYKHFSQSLPPVAASPQQLEQVFVNLIVNAADAMGDMQNGQLIIRTTHEEGCIRAYIEDVGPGIPQDKLESIWEAFFTTKPPEQGTGLGLAIVRNIVKEHSGRIWAENRLEGGARFVVEFPLTEA